jgi:hypothetical protein
VTLNPDIWRSDTAQADDRRYSFRAAALTLALATFASWVLVGLAVYGSFAAVHMLGHSS